ncbi:MAG: phospholipase A [Gammaproteobacteria bacterium]|nr:phospholipase A [Gammaproteobacteria bacterium]
MPIVRNLFILSLAALLWPIPSTSAETLDKCLLQQIHQPANEALSVLEIKNYCLSQLSISSPDTNSIETPPPIINIQEYRQARFSEFFEPYKESYLVFGSMKNSDGGTPFSGETLDIKFELGMKFRLFPDQPIFQGLAPLYFGYSQKSWWDIAESSAPFKEHNYNPEVFWDYSKTSNKNGLNFVGRYLDRVGYEHQSNGLDETKSRSWDRLYLQRSFNLSDQFSLSLKAWDVVNIGDENSDIEDYLGNLQLNASFRPNERLTIKLETMKGHKTSKYSYQLDFVYRIPEWVNSEFIISYYDGYGEALVSYNEKTSSLRAGFSFPVVLGGR